MGGKGGTRLILKRSPGQSWDKCRYPFEVIANIDENGACEKGKEKIREQGKPGGKGARWRRVAWLVQEVLHAGSLLEEGGTKGVEKMLGHPA